MIERIQDIQLVNGECLCIGNVFYGSYMGSPVTISWSGQRFDIYEFEHRPVGYMSGGLK